MATFTIKASELIDMRNAFTKLTVLPFKNSKLIMGFALALPKFEAAVASVLKGRELVQRQHMKFTKSGAISKDADGEIVYITSEEELNEAVHEYMSGEVTIDAPKVPFSDITPFLNPDPETKLYVTGIDLARLCGIVDLTEVK